MTAYAKPGKIVIISSPSGGGKTSICRALLNEDRVAQGWAFSISYTTRERRTDEVNGREYHFVNDQEFEKLIGQDFFAEYFRVHLYQYGTPRNALEKVLNEGGVMLLDVDVQGAARLKSEYPAAITIFIRPPSLDALSERLERRGTETPEQLTVRKINAIREMELDGEFDHVVINDKLDIAVNDVINIITEAPCEIRKTEKGTN